MSDRLNEDSLADLPEGVRRPAYDRKAIKTGIVHLGVGAFHRAHQAVYTDDVLGQDPRWGIVAASLRSPDTYDALDPQDGLYTLAVRSQAGEALRVIGSIRQVIVAPREVEQLLEAMSAPQTRIVTLTVTEKGYCHDPATGALNEVPSGHRARPRVSQNAQVGARLHRRGTAPPARGGRAALHGAHLR